MLPLTLSVPDLIALLRKDTHELHASAGNDEGLEPSERLLEQLDRRLAPISPAKVQVDGRAANLALVFQNSFEQV